jgi:hypothetical protein
MLLYYIYKYCETRIESDIGSNNNQYYTPNEIRLKRLRHHVREVIISYY